MEVTIYKHFKFNNSRPHSILKTIFQNAITSMQSTAFYSKRQLKSS